MEYEGELPSHMGELYRLLPEYAVVCFSCLVGDDCRAMTLRDAASIFRRRGWRLIQPGIDGWCCPECLPVIRRHPAAAASGERP